MTREEALSILKTFRITGDKHREAFDMAIKSLERIPSYEAGYNDAKIEIALSGEYERAYKRGKADARTERWIPVSERLPGKYGEYMITWTTSNSSRDRCFLGMAEYDLTEEYDHENSRFKGEWLLEDYVKNYKDVKVIAWMPLPEAYSRKRGSMKIVIDIDDEDYKRIQDIPDVFNSLTSRAYSAIRNGTPLSEERTEERTETHACDCISRQAAFDEILREVETLRRDVRELKELLGYIREYGIAKDKTPRHIAERFCEIVDGWEEQDESNEADAV